MTSQESQTQLSGVEMFGIFPQVSPSPVISRIAAESSSPMVSREALEQGLRDAGVQFLEPIDTDTVFAPFTDTGSGPNNKNGVADTEPRTYAELDDQGDKNRYTLDQLTNADNATIAVNNKAQAQNEHDFLGIF